MRFFRSGPGGVIRRVLGLQATLPTNALEDVRPVIEMRALRDWEFFDEGIERYSIHAGAGPTVAEFSGIAILPRAGFFRVVKFVDFENTALANVGFRIIDVPDIATFNPFSAGVLVSGGVLDGRLASQTTTQALAIRGSNAAQQGTAIRFPQASPGAVFNVGFIVTPPNVLPGRQAGLTFSVWHQTANILLNTAYELLDVPIDM